MSFQVGADAGGGDGWGEEAADFEIRLEDEDGGVEIAGAGKDTAHFYNFFSQFTWQKTTFPQDVKHNFFHCRRRIYWVAHPGSGPPAP